MHFFKCAVRRSYAADQSAPSTLVHLISTVARYNHLPPIHRPTSLDLHSIAENALVEARWVREASCVCTTVRYHLLSVIFSPAMLLANPNRR